MQNLSFPSSVEVLSYFLVYPRKMSDLKDNEHLATHLSNILYHTACQNVVKGIQMQLPHPTQPTLLHNVSLIGFIPAS